MLTDTEKPASVNVERYCGCKTALWDGCICQADVFTSTENFGKKLKHKILDASTFPSLRYWCCHPIAFEFCSHDSQDLPASEETLVRDLIVPNFRAFQMYNYFWSYESGVALIMC